MGSQDNDMPAAPSWHPTMEALLPFPQGARTLRSRPGGCRIVTRMSMARRNTPHPFRREMKVVTASPGPAGVVYLSVRDGGSIWPGWAE